MGGGDAEIMSTSLAEPVPFEFVAEIVTSKLPI
jgi:hypothetical protein